MKYRVEIRLRQGVKDIESEAIYQAANGNPELADGQLISLSMGKWFEVECEDDFDINALCTKLLANTVIEKFEIQEII